MWIYFLATLFNYVNVPVLEMRELPQQEAEIVSQAFYSEPVSLLEERGAWVRIETEVDHYQGWVKIETEVDRDLGGVKKKNLCSREQPFIDKATEALVKVDRLAAHLYPLEDTVFGPLLTLPYESKLMLMEPKDDGKSRWLKVATVEGKIAYIQRGDVVINPPLLKKSEIGSFSLRFLNLPYTWGGRSSFGYDCSGFVQMLYRQMGIYLPRDAKQQINWEGFAPISLDRLHVGDLIFFGLGIDKIRHVGLYLGEDQFIHSTVGENAPYIHLSNLKDPEWNGSGKWVYRAARTLKN